jgi:hypothetical protein
MGKKKNCFKNYGDKSLKITDTKRGGILVD